MGTIFLSHLLISTAFFLLVAIATRLIRSPQLNHALWILVLVKLATPPIALLTLPTLDELNQDASPPTTLAPSSATPSNTTLSSTTPNLPLLQPRDSSPDPGTSEAVTEAFEPVESIGGQATNFAWWAVGRNSLLAVWGIGSIFYLALIAKRLFQLRKLLAYAIPASSSINRTVESLGKTMDIKNLPQVQLVDALISPLLCSLNFKPVILLPQKLTSTLSRAQLETVIAHELAHLKRRDHFVRWLEAVVLTVFWWNPIAWLSQKMLREAEEECCDAWVVWALPSHRRSYGLALLQTNEFLTDGVVPTTAVASAFGRPFFKRRIEMILKSHKHRHMSRLSIGILVVLAGSVLPVGAQDPAQPQDEQTAKGSPPPLNESPKVEATVEAEKPEDVPDILAVIEQVSEANGIEVSEKELDQRVELTARKFSMSADKFLSLITEQRGFSEKEYKTQMVRPQLVLEKLLQVKHPKAMVPTVAAYLSVLRARQGTSAQQLQGPSLSPAPIEPSRSNRATTSTVAGTSSQSNSALLETEVEYLRAKVKFLEAQLRELGVRN